MTTAVVGATDLVRVIRTYAETLSAHRDAINRLNVYPVPDGDTGTNMTLTLRSVAGELDELDVAQLSDMALVAKAISHGSLMGARGNSGVILSQILRGLCSVLDDRPDAGAAEVASALAAASAAAYGAVLKPVEGTILTVVREASVAAVAAAEGGADLTGVLDVARVAAGHALDRTPELLPVLAAAGVVDAGGRGFVLFLDAWLNVVDGRPLPTPEIEAAPLVTAAIQHLAGDVADLRYEVMFFLDAPDDVVPAFREAWGAIGESIVVVGGDGMWNCHVHTNDIGAAIEVGIEVGRPRKIRVTDLFEEVDERPWVAQALDTAADRTAVTCATVAVCVGSGVRRIFESMGVQHVVEGGQTMNPSTADLLAAVEAVNAPQVLLLPNNKNVIPVAEQVDGQTSKTVRVVPTRSVVEGLAALVAYDPEDGADHNLAQMLAAAAGVVTGEVTIAVRDTITDLGPVGTGDYIGLAAGDGLVSCAPTAVEAACRLLDVIIGDDHELVTVIYGSDALEPDRSAIVEWLAAEHPDVEVEVHNGGQPLYPYYFGVE